MAGAGARLASGLVVAFLIAVAVAAAVALLARRHRCCSVTIHVKDRQSRLAQAPAMSQLCFDVILRLGGGRCSVRPGLLVEMQRAAAALSRNRGFREIGRSGNLGNRKIGSS